MLKSLKKINFFLKKKKEIYLIESIDDKAFVEDSLLNEKLIGIDTEFNWRKTYFPELSLLQISTESQILLIDYLKFKSLSFLKKILESNQRLIIVHSSRSDATVLSTNLKIKLKNTFDIQLAEKEINGGFVKNYGSIVLNYSGYKLDKSETNSNWLKRPLKSKQLEYAANDVNFLIPIYKKQIKKLKRRDQVKKVMLDSRKEVEKGNQELHISRLKKLKRASNDEKDIFIWREKQASIKNLPPSFIFEDKFLKQITKEVKKNKSQEVIKFFKDSSSINDFLQHIEL